jgi:hypothetical protein
MGAQRALEKLEPLIQWFKNKTGFHLQKPESHHERKSESEPCHRKTQATSMKPWPREMKIHSSGEHPTKQAEKINLLSEQLCRVLEQVEPFRMEESWVGNENPFCRPTTQEIEK